MGDTWLTIPRRKSKGVFLFASLLLFGIFLFGAQLVPSLRDESNPNIRALNTETETHSESEGIFEGIETSEEEEGEAHATSKSTSHEGEASHSTSASESHSTSASESHEAGAHGNEEEEESEPPYAILFPWFANAIGVVTFYLLTRYCHALPYTAVLFVAGIFMGVGVTQLGLKDQLTESIDMWTGINAEVLLLVFLPGLLFRDAFGVNFHLFCKSFVQLLLLAFPMVLAGTCLTALIGFYIFPYGWSFNLSMTFGSIMAATDPVAVAALMNEVGAPPRLKMHIGGEAMLNDGSAMVFFTIFSNLFLYETGVAGMEVNLAQGFEIFFRMALGGAVVGCAFGGALITILYLFNRRLEMEENVLQVTATITIAYLAYYTSEMVCKMSGVIAVVFCGICTQAFAGGMVNDPGMMESFWILVEHLLNTILFALAGVIWGSIISDKDALFHFSAVDWGYLFILYILAVVMRFLLIGFFYPIVSRIGLKSSWQEAVFASWGGLRGAVGIALSLALNSETLHLVLHSGADEKYGAQTVQLFAMVGGIAFITLVINGTLSGPILRKLGLVKSTAARKLILDSIHHTVKNDLLDDLVRLLADSRFQGIDFAVVKHYVPFLSNVTAKEFRVAIRNYKDTCPKSEYVKPNLKNVVPYLEGLDEVLVSSKGGKKTKAVPNVTYKFEGGEQVQVTQELINATRKIQRFWRYKMSGDTSNMDKMFGGGGAGSILQIAKQAVRVTELRRIYVELLRMSYERQIEDGELDAREGGGFVVYALKQSLEFAYDEVNRGMTLQDWEKTQMVRNNFINQIKRSVGGLFKKCFCRSKSVGNGPTRSYSSLCTTVHIAIGFIEAHKSAQTKFLKEFASAEFGDANDIVLKESEEQVMLAKQVFKEDGVDGIVTRLLCGILLNKQAHHIETLASQGLLMDREVTHFIEEISESIDHLRESSETLVPGQHSPEQRKKFDETMRHADLETSFYLV